MAVKPWNGPAVKKQLQQAKRRQQGNYRLTLEQFDELMPRSIPALHDELRIRVLRIYATVKQEKSCRMQ